MDDVVEPAAADLQLPKVLAALADPHRLATVQLPGAQRRVLVHQVMQKAGLE